MVRRHSGARAAGVDQIYPDRPFQSAIFPHNCGDMAVFAAL